MNQERVHLPQTVRDTLKNQAIAYRKESEREKYGSVGAVRLAAQADEIEAFLREHDPYGERIDLLRKLREFVAWLVSSGKVDTYGVTYQYSRVDGRPGELHLSGKMLKAALDTIDAQAKDGAESAIQMSRWEPIEEAMIDWAYYAEIASSAERVATPSAGLVGWKLYLDTRKSNHKLILKWFDSGRVTGMHAVTFPDAQDRAGSTTDRRSVVERVLGD